MKKKIHVFNDVETFWRYVDSIVHDCTIRTSMLFINGQLVARLTSKKS